MPTRFGGSQPLDAQFLAKFPQPAGAPRLVVFDDGDLPEE